MTPNSANDVLTELNVSLSLCGSAATLAAYLVEETDDKMLVGRNLQEALRGGSGAEVRVQFVLTSEEWLPYLLA